MPGYTYAYPHPAVATDIAIFTLAGADLRLLLIRRGEEPFKGEWSLPGGFVRPEEDLDACANRELREETGVEAEALYHFGNFSAPRRDPRERVISVAYLALLPVERVPRAGSDAVHAEWRSANDLPPLAFDHKQIVEAALVDLRRRAKSIKILLALLPPRFTLGQLQAAYEAVSDRKEDKRNFRKFALESKVIAETDDFERGRHRPARLYERCEHSGRARRFAAR